MDAAARRKAILERLAKAGSPVSASALAGELGVSRQIVVGDVALLRAGGARIDATPRGYRMLPAAAGIPAWWPASTTPPKRCAGNCTRWRTREAPWWM